MRPPPRFLAAAPALLAACLDDPPVTTADACPIEERVLLAAAPAKFSPEPDTYYDFFAAGDHLLYTFDPPDDPGRTYWHKQRCSGDAEKFPSLLPGLHHPFTIDTPDGPLLYARDAANNNTFVVDRLDDPAADVPRRVLDLPTDLERSPHVAGRRYVLFSRPTDEDADDDVRDAAGVGATRYTLYTHAGDPDVPATRVGGTIVQHRELDDRMFVLDDDGNLDAFDPVAGTRTPLLTGVRHFDLAPDHRRMIWQAIGDDIAEPVYLRDLDTGVELQIAVNDYTDRCWGRGPASYLGAWVWTPDARAAATMAPDEALLAAVRADTGAPLPIPAGYLSTVAYDRYFVLYELTDTEVALSLWEPLAGDLRTVYRGELYPMMLWAERDRAEFLLVGDQLDLWSIDLATGDATRKIAGFPELIYSRIDDQRYLLRESVGLVDVSAGKGLDYDVLDDLFVADTRSGAVHPLVEGVVTYAVYPGEGVVFLDAAGPEPGVWAVPFPK